MRELHSDEEKGLFNAISFDKHPKTAEANKNIKFKILHTKLDGALELILK